jgi:hypothetical protein
MAVTILFRSLGRFARTLGIGVWLLSAWPADAAAQAEVIIEWNQIMLEATTTPGALPPTVFFTYPSALTHAAIYDAVNAIDPQYAPWAVRVGAAPGASRAAAAAQAAHDVLSAFFPAQRERFGAALAATLATLPPGAAREGARVGAATAREILELRRFDGWGRVPPPYQLPPEPGNWQPAPAPAAFTHYPDVEPFLIGSARQFRVEPPPPLTSERYATDLNEVKALGSAISTVRTEDQTLVARLFAGVGTPTGPPWVWNLVAREVVRARGLSILDAARVFAFLNMVHHDALLVSMSNKYEYGLWRPVTAIRGADRDGNPATTADPGWTTLIGTPAYPSYPGNVACLGGSGSRLLEHLFGQDNVPFSITWLQPGGPGWTRSYNGFRQFADEAARSRIYGGIHYQFDTLASMGVCTQLADYAYANTLRPLFEETHED